MLVYAVFAVYEFMMISFENNFDDSQDILEQEAFVTTDQVQLQEDNSMASRRIMAVFGTVVLLYLMVIIKRVAKSERGAIIYAISMTVIYW